MSEKSPITQWNEAVIVENLHRAARAEIARENLYEAQLRGESEARLTVLQMRARQAEVQS